MICKICHFSKYVGKDNGYSPECRPFDCYYCYHGDCLEYWKFFFLKQNQKVAKQINCPSCRSPVRDECDHLYTYKWKVDGSGIKLSVNSKIEIVVVDDSKKTDTLNFREKQNSAINVYNTKLKVTLEKFKVWMDDNRLQENTFETKRQGGRVRNVPDRYGNNNSSLTVKSLLVKITIPLQ